MTFRVGQKVAFVGGTPDGRESPTIPCRLKIGSVYTIREIEAAYIPGFGVAGIRVEEEVYPTVWWNGREFEPAHLACHFRPIVERKTDISIFTKMLTPQGVDA